MIPKVGEQSPCVKITNLVAFGDALITVTTHPALNTVKGVISENDLIVD